MDEIGVVQLLEGCVDEGAVDVGVRGQLGLLEHEHEHGQQDGGGW